MSEIQPADPEVRRRSIILLLIISALFLPLIWWLNENVESFERWIADPIEGLERAKLAIMILVASGVLLLLVVAVYVNNFANSILSAERYPPPNKIVIKDTKIRRGESARRIGKVLKGYVVAVLLIVFTLIIVGWKMIQTIEGLVGK